MLMQPELTMTVVSPGADFGVRFFATGLATRRILINKDGSIHTPDGSHSPSSAAAVIHRTDDGWLFRPLNGAVFHINSNPVASPRLLQAGDHVRLGPRTWHFDSDIVPAVYMNARDLGEEDRLARVYEGIKRLARKLRLSREDPNVGHQR